MTWLALRAFIATPLGRYLIIAALVVSAAFAAGWHERNVGRNERDVQAKQEIVSLNKSWVDAEAAAIKKSKDEAQAEHAAHEKDQDGIIAGLKKDLANGKTQAAKDVAAARAGHSGLRIPAPACPSGANVPNASGPPGGGNDSSTIPIPPETAASLFSLADDADAVVAQLTACQAIVISDRKVFSTTKGVP